MSIIIDKNTKAIVQGITGHEGSFHTKLMKEFGTKIIAGVTPGKGGQTIEGIPVYNSVKEAVKKHKPNFSVIFVPAAHAKEAAFESLQNNLHLVIITEHIPVHDVLEIMQLAKQKKKIVIGPNCPGITSTGKCKLGIMPNHIFKKGKVGIISRSGTLTYEIINQISNSGLGISTAIGIGGDAVIGLDFIEALKHFAKDKETKAVVIIGEIGGNLEEKAAEFIKKTKYKKKVVAYIAGRTAPKGKRMGHAGAIISGNTGTAQSKIKAFESAKVPVARLPSDIIRLLKK